MDTETNLVQIISCPNAESKENSFEEDCGDKEDIIVKHTKISDVPKENQIRLDDQTLFQFSTYIENDKLVLKLDEIGAFAPFIFLKKLTLEDFIKIHKMFKSCDDLEEVQKHIGKLFADGRIKLDQKKDAEDTIILKIKARHISGEVEIEIKLPSELNGYEMEIDPFTALPEGLEFDGEKITGISGGKFFLVRLR